MKRICELCGKVQEGKKRFNDHHISYSKNITISLCYLCHCAVHCRIRFNSNWEYKYGKDKGFYELSKKFIEVYDEKMKGLK